MDFRLLRPLEVILDDGTSASLSQRLHRLALSFMLLRAREPVPRRMLFDALWGDRMPSDPAGSLRTCIYGLRKALGDPAILQTDHGGIVLALREGDRLDCDSFRDLTSSGLKAWRRGDHLGAARLLRDALDLWREPALADCPDHAHGLSVVYGLLEERSRAQEVLADARLAMGHHRDLVGWLRELTASDPLRERLWEQLMIALYRSGYQAAALETYTHIRSVLIERLGIDPGPGLQGLHHRILVRDPTLMSTQSAGLHPEVMPAKLRPSGLIASIAGQNWSISNQEVSSGSSCLRRVPGAARPGINVRAAR